MSKALVEKRLIETGDRIKQLRDDLRVAEEQLGHFAAEADDARIRSLVSETPLAEREHRDAARHAQTMQRHHDEVTAEIKRLESQQDQLLDQLTEG